MSVVQEVEGAQVALLKGSPAVRSTAARPLPWHRVYLAAVVGVDLVAAMTGALAAYLLGWGAGAPTDGLPVPLLLVGLPCAWVALLASLRLYEARYLGVGSEEFRRVGRAAILLLAGCGVLAYATSHPVAREFVLVALPLTVALDAGGRYGARKTLQSARRRGHGMHKVLVVGPHAGVESFVAELGEERAHGLQVVGVCYVDQDSRLHDGDAPPDLGALEDLGRAVEVTGADTVAVLTSPETAGLPLRQIAWRLEASRAQLLVAPGLVEVAGSRLTVRPAAGLPLLHLDRPELTGGRRWLKSALDRTLALLGLVLLLPAFAVLVLLIQADGCGRGLYRQTRIGLGGRAFTIYKFRTMCADAEAMRAQLQDSNERSEGPLFKLREDPRVTRLGRILRRYSLDELPQLLNVVRGEMSFVGPRPPLPEEVAQYGAEVRRRLLVKPGLTGLWQVNGRSDLSWQESVRLDLRYVDNWSLGLDLQILWKTLRVVLRGSGAY